jgi:hypothetical protein
MKAGALAPGSRRRSVYPQEHTDDPCMTGLQVTHRSLYRCSEGKIWSWRNWSVAWFVFEAVDTIVPFATGFSQIGPALNDLL